VAGEVLTFEADVSQVEVADHDPDRELRRRGAVRGSPSSRTRMPSAATVCSSMIRRRPGSGQLHLELVEVDHELAAGQLGVAQDDRAAARPMTASRPRAKGPDLGNTFEPAGDGGADPRAREDAAQQHGDEEHERDAASTAMAVRLRCRYLTRLAPPLQLA